MTTENKPLPPGQFPSPSFDRFGLGLFAYKNIKHIGAIEFWRERGSYRFPLPYPDLMDHPRGRVALEERARFLPLWLIRPLYRALIPMTRWQSRKALEAYQARKDA